MLLHLARMQLKISVISLREFMNEDFQSIEINKLKISYYHKRLENQEEWLDEMINKIEDLKNKISEVI